jgi:hypothetical protein
VVVAIAVALTTAGSAAEALTADGWTIQHVGRSNNDYTHFALTGNQRGDAVLAWATRGDIRVAVARRGRPFGRRVIVPGSRDGSDPKVAMNARGDALLVWSYWDHTYAAPPESRDSDCCFPIRATILDHRGRFRRLQTVTRRGADAWLGGYALDRSGRMGVIWCTGDDFGCTTPYFFGRFSGRGGRLGHRSLVARNAGGLALAYLHGRPRALLAAPRGRYTALYETVRARRRWGPRTLVAEGLPAYFWTLTAVANASGDEAVVWQPDYNSYGEEPLYAGIREAGGRLSITRLTLHPRSGTPAIAIGPTGWAAVAWPGRAGLRLSVGSTYHRFPTAPYLAASRPDGDWVSGIDLAVDGSGRVAIGWQGRRKGRPAILGAIRTPNGHETRLGRFAGGFDLHIPELGAATFDGHGRAILAWQNGLGIDVARTVAR